MNNNVLWISSITFPEAIARLNNIETDFRSSGGWIVALAEAISKDEAISLIVASIEPSVKETIEIKGDGILYILFPQGKSNKYYENQFLIISNKYSPKCVHIHGTEHELGLHYLNACGNNNVVVSMQGVITEIAKHYNDGLSFMTILKNITIRDLVKGSIFCEKRKFQKKGVIERKILRSVSRVIGRTTFDRAFAVSVNNRLEYYYCSEVLRSQFYEGEWSYDKCQPHTIFLSQSYYPVKGLHFVLEALPDVIRLFPDLRVRIAGFDFTRDTGAKLDWTRRSGYGKIIREMIFKNNLKEHVVFLGQLNAEEMKREFLNANLFICSSTCENSPNSLCEAQILGTPCLASYVGGVPDTYIGDKQYLYQYDNPSILSYKIQMVIANNRLEPQKESIAQLQQRHSIENITKTVLDIYRLIGQGYEAVK